MEQAVQHELISFIYHKMLSTYPELRERYSLQSLQHIKQDIEHHLEYLLSAGMIHMDSIFLDYVDWVNRVLTARGIETYYLVDCFKWMGMYLSDCNKEGHYTYSISLLHKAVWNLSSIQTLER
ncbi:hypothetical protein N781_11660 [Pontibacillus halophilus JSM 076056 = DSM 19796]|uniref:Uncharacterized protein n=1 Tax=Pontibacillus halophilus JSM 076056 = DSM 19796 TaxID=1385510 RepID=A0A0A5GPZ1_9BACI|nr:hypothetical protein [Pontibacillus halophilus]KGX93318.1 hypothetical protein N781_11660 [Pontibacillus halophilus JSM 076056 = DSM 19796]